MNKPNKNTSGSGRGRKKPASGGRPGSNKPTRGGRDEKSPYPKKGPKDSKSDRPYKSFKKVKSKSAEDLAPRKGNAMRINRVLAIAGIASRREADKLIEAGLVTINGKVVTELGTKVKASDDVRYNGTRIKAEQKVYLVMNKPKGFITTVTDPKARKTVMELFGDNVKERVYPVGRLDRATSGVLMFTNDGDLAKKLTHPSHGARKLYQVTLDKSLTQADMTKILGGVELEDGPVPVDSISYVQEKSKTNIGIEIHIGRNRIVRRLFEHLGYEVVKLDRVSFAGLTKKNLSRGQWRHLTQQELNYLKMLK